VLIKLWPDVITHLFSTACTVNRLTYTRPVTTYFGSCEPPAALRMWIRTHNQFFAFLFIVRQPLGNLGLLSKVSRSQWEISHSVGLLWTCDRTSAQTSTWQRTAHSRGKYPCLRRDSNPQSQQASGPRAATGVGNSLHGVQNVTVSYTNILRFRMSACLYTSSAQRVLRTFFCHWCYGALWNTKHCEQLGRSGNIST